MKKKPPSAEPPLDSWPGYLPPAPNHPKLRKKIALLKQKGINVCLGDSPPMKAYWNVVRDLTAYEMKELVDLAISDVNEAIMRNVMEDAEPEHGLLSLHVPSTTKGR